MRPNPLKPRLAAGGRAYGTMACDFFVPGLAAMAQAAGAEFLMLDGEHGGLGIETVKAQCAFARGLALVPIVRIADTAYPMIANALDAGAMGIMAPMVGTAEEARFLVSCKRYPPEGRRGAAFGLAHDDYLPGSVPDKIAAAHARIMVIAMIETTEGLANVEAIAAVPGVDVVWMGHFDLTNSMGIPGQFDHPDYNAAVARIVAAANGAGKTPGIMVADEAWARDYTARGFRMMAYGLDGMLYQRELARGLAILRDAAG